jgi:hypothetical protein
MIHINVMTRQLHQVLYVRRYKERNINNTEYQHMVKMSHIKSHKKEQQNPEYLNKERLRSKNRREYNSKRLRDQNYGKGASDHLTAQLRKQSNCCAICKEPFLSSFGTHFDHDHLTRQWRGALCCGCNAGLGNFKENPNIFAAAIEYLMFWKEQL